MNAIHIISTAPFFSRGKTDYQIEDFDLYCAALSALCWRKYNGKITLCADKCAADYIRQIGFEALWDEINVCLSDDLDGINPSMFWAGGKILALAKTDAPVVMLDTDFIVWKKLDFGNEIIAAHREELMPNVYPPFEYFRAHGHIIPDFSESVLPLNTAFLYLPDNDFKEFYTSQAIAFMKSAERSDDPLCYMVFAEQRMLAMCAEHMGVSVKTLLDKDHLFFPQDSFTHLWGAKQAMRDNAEQRADFLSKCRARLCTDFPEYSYIADIIDGMAR